MLRFPLLHPPLLAALGAAGEGGWGGGWGRVLLADANLLLTIGFVDPR